MKDVGFTAVDDYCRNVADDEEVAKLEASIARRKQELARRAEMLKPKVARVFEGSPTPSDPPDTGGHVSPYGLY